MCSGHISKEPDGTQKLFCNNTVTPLSERVQRNDESCTRLTAKKPRKGVKVDSIAVIASSFPLNKSNPHKGLPASKSLHWDQWLHNMVRVDGKERRVRVETEPCNRSDWRTEPQVMKKDLPERNLLWWIGWESLRESFSCSFSEVYCVIMAWRERRRK